MKALYLYVYPVVFIARCYAERGNATVSRHLSLCLWRSGTVIT